MPDAFDTEKNVTIVKHIPSCDIPSSPKLIEIQVVLPRLSVSNDSKHLRLVTSVRPQGCENGRVKFRALGCGLHCCALSMPCPTGYTMVEAEPALLSCADGQFVGGEPVSVHS